MSVRAKFKVDQITQTQTGRTILMSPVYSNDEKSENKQFWQWTPSGKIEMAITNPSAFNQFELGKEYYIDFSAAPTETAAEAA